jgi:hypothetical protein
MYGVLGYAEAYVHLFYVLSCIDRFPFRLESVSADDRNMLE